MRIFGQMKKWKPELMKCFQTCVQLMEAKISNVNYLGTQIKKKAECETNKSTSKLLTAKCTWNRSETFVVDDGWEDFRSENLLVDTKQVLKEENIFAMNQHLIVQTEEDLNYTMNLTFALSKQFLEEPNMQCELLQERAEVSTVLQDVQQGKLFQVATFYAGTLLLEEGNKGFELDKNSGFVNEQHFVLHEDLNGKAMYQNLSHGVATHNKSAKGNTKNETQTMNSHFEKKADFDFKLSLVDKAIPSHSNVWNHWTGIGNSRMDTLAKANCIDETQFSNGHNKQPKKRIVKIERISKRKMEGRAQLSTNWIQDGTIWLNWLHDLRDNLLVAITKMCSMNVPATASLRNGCYNGPATPFKAKGTLKSFGKLEVSDHHSALGKPDDKKLKFCDERSSVTLYKQKQKRNSTAEQLLEENFDVATKNVVSVSKEQLSSQQKYFCTDNIEHKGKNFRSRMNSL